MHGGGSDPSCCAFTHRVAFEEGSGSEGEISQMFDRRSAAGNEPESLSRIPPGVPRDAGPHPAGDIEMGRRR